MGSECSIDCCSQPDASTTKNADILTKKDQLAKFEAQMRSGMIVQKLSSDRPMCRVSMRIANGKLSFHGEDEEDTTCREDADLITQNICDLSVRRATDPDPLMKDYAGSQILRDNLEPRDALRAFIIEGTNGSSPVYVNILCLNDKEAGFLISGLRNMVNTFKE